MAPDVKTRNVRSVEPDRAVRRRQRAVQRLAELLLSVARYAGHAENLAGMKVEAQMVEQRHAVLRLNREIPHLKPDLPPAFRIAFLPKRLEVVSDHKPCQLGRTRPGLLHLAADPAVPHDDDPVRDLHDLLHLMRDEDHGIAFRREGTDELHQRLDLLREKHGGRLVHDEDPGVAVQRLQDLHLLLDTDGKIPDPRAGGHAEMIAVGQALNLLLLGCVVDPSAHGAEDDVLRHRVGVHQREMLLDHRDSERHRVLRRPDAAPDAVDPDLSGGFMIEAVEDLHDCALAGPVFSEQRHHLAASYRKRHIVVGEDLREPLGDMPQLNNRCFHSSLHPS